MQQKLVKLLVFIQLTTVFIDPNAGDPSKFSYYRLFEKTEKVGLSSSNKSYNYKFSHFHMFKRKMDGKN